ncbi:MAG: MEKHLA domain-containing protein [Desulfuromonadaceae bacterium]
MEKISEPCAENDYLGEHVERLLSSLLRLTGRPLVDPELAGAERYRAVFEASFALVSHNAAADPVFNYGNKTALQLFEMPWDVFTHLPSRYSAEKQIREERERLLARVAQQGFIDDYRGVRVSSSGKRFLVEDAIVWNVVDEEGSYHGQAAVLFSWSAL